jgi:hypothetical protein
MTLEEPEVLHEVSKTLFSVIGKQTRMGSKSWGVNCFGKWEWKRKRSMVIKSLCLRGIHKLVSQMKLALSKKPRRNGVKNENKTSEGLSLFI